MVWNKDLAKLKQELKSEEHTDPKRPVPKPAPKPAAPRELNDEDALFLAAMGGRRKSGPLAPDALIDEPPPMKPAPEKADFSEAMATLKGVKPVPSAKIPLQKAAPEPAPPPPPPDPEADVQATPEPAIESPAVPLAETPSAPESPQWTPPLIQLAAGMAIEVDGALDLRGHSAPDAVERLKERVLDGHLLGWRTLHIQLGSSDELKQAFLAYLTGPEAGLIARYAQAPIPMGGAQAWILYLGLQGPATH